MAAASWRTANLLWPAADLLVKRHGAEAALVAARHSRIQRANNARAGIVDG